MNLNKVSNEILFTGAAITKAFEMTGELEKTHCFKVENKFIVKSGCKKRMWRSLKQILAADRALPWPSDAVLCKYRM